MEKPNKSIFVVLGIFVAVGIIGAFLVYSKSASTSLVATNNDSNLASVTSESVTPNLSPTSTGEEAVKEIIIEGDEYKFTPSSISLNKGEKIKLTFVNNGGVPHDLVINDLNVKTKIIGPGKSDIVEFTPENTGVFSFVCSVGNHEALGMKGAATVR